MTAIGQRRPAPGRKCSVCTHEHTAEISKAIMGGASNRSIAERYGLVHTSVQRHRTNCLQQRRRSVSPAAEHAPSQSPGTPRFDSSDPKSLVSATVQLVDKALDLMGHAERVDDRRMALAALREARESLGLLMRAAGMLGSEGTTINVDARRQSVELLAKIGEGDLRSYIAALADTDDNQALSRFPGISAAPGSPAGLSSQRGADAIGKSFCTRDSQYEGGEGTITPSPSASAGAADT